MKTENQTINYKEKYEVLRSEIIVLEAENNVLRNYVGLKPKTLKNRTEKCIVVDFTLKKDKSEY